MKVWHVLTAAVLGGGAAAAGLAVSNGGGTAGPSSVASQGTTTTTAPAPVSGTPTAPAVSTPTTSARPTAVSPISAAPASAPNTTTSVRPAPSTTTTTNPRQTYAGWQCRLSATNNELPGHTYTATVWSNRSGIPFSFSVQPDRPQVTGRPFGEQEAVSTGGTQSFTYTVPSNEVQGAYTAQAMDHAPYPVGCNESLFVQPS